jgi:exosortase/archaeosortase family protein
VAADTQVLNLLLWFGCVIALEDRMQDLWPRPSRASFWVGSLLLLIMLLRGDWTTNTQDRFVYLMLPLSTVALALLNRPFHALRIFRVPLVIAFLLPITRVFFSTHAVITPVTTVLTWLTLTTMGFSPIMSKANIFMGNSGVEIAGNCTGIDQIVFTLSVALIFLMVFPLSRWPHRWLVLGVAVFSALIVNVMRISLLTWLVSLPNDSGTWAFEFFHDSVGGLLFSLISVSVMGWCHTALIDRELSARRLKA